MLYLYSNSHVYIQLNHCGSTVKSVYLYITIIVLLQYYYVILQRAVTVGHWICTLIISSSLQMAAESTHVAMTLIKKAHGMSHSPQLGSGLVVSALQGTWAVVRREPTTSPPRPTVPSLETTALQAASRTRITDRAITV